MTTVFSDVLRAHRAIPESGNNWADSRLKYLGEQVKALYPELVSWGPQLAGEAHLFYVAKAPRVDDGVTESHPGSVRHDTFLSFLSEPSTTPRTDLIGKTMLMEQRKDLGDSTRLARQVLLIVLAMMLVGGGALAFSSNVHWRIVGALFEGIGIGVFAGSKLALWKA
ncbi:hypothetical protein [Paraburkholderia sp. SIMBA_054]|uniref:hypothetical protein n=1 Tax=Paraburkholderia sp. SIMBA_054 TaxID=3085795 RepID=UPI00397B511E